MTTLQRRPDWPERFIAFIESRRGTPFAWGTNDCALFAADGVLAVTDVDLAAAWRGYSTEAGAAQRVAAAGGMRGFARDLVEKPVGRAQRGDIMLAAIEGRETYGLAIGSGHWAAPGAAGLVFRPMSDAVAVFEV